MHAPRRPPTTQMCIWNASGKADGAFGPARRDPAATRPPPARLAGGALSCCSRACSSPLMSTARAIVASMRRLSRARGSTAGRLSGCAVRGSRSSDPLIPLRARPGACGCGRGRAAQDHWFSAPALAFDAAAALGILCGAAALLRRRSRAPDTWARVSWSTDYWRRKKGTSLIFPKTSRVTSEVPFFVPRTIICPGTAGR